MIESTLRGIRLHILVQPNGRKSELLGEHNGQLKVRIHAPPVDGKANEAVEQFIADFFGVPVKMVSLVRGQSARSKVLAIENLDIESAKKLIGNALKQLKP